MSNLTPGDDRRRELQADRALFGLSPEEQRELAALAGAGRIPRTHGDDVADELSEFDELEFAAAALDLALYADAEQPLPAHLRDRILKASRTASAAPAAARATLPSSLSATQASGPTRRELTAWFVAAAALLVAAYLGTRTPATSSAPSAAALREQLLAKRGENAPVQVAWTRGEDETAAKAEGDVVWSDSDQRGVMRFRGLAANNPTDAQYQLWIFDAERDDAHPVDGGVFDIPAGSGDVLVPIAAKLPVGHAKMFAITVERPGGVVVSDRSRLPLLAQVP
jgi:hypothetical protein